MTNDSVHVDHVRAPPDWGILFVDGEVAYANHTVEGRDVLRELEGKAIESWEHHFVDDVEKRGEMPINKAVKYELYGDENE